MGSISWNTHLGSLSRFKSVCMHLICILSELSTFALHCGDFSLFSIFYFLFSFLRAHKKHKNANNRISYFFPLRCFLSAFFLFACSVLYFCLVASLCFLCFLWFLCFLCFWCFWCFWCFLCFLCFLCVRNIFVKNKEFKTALITSFILLLNSSYYKHEFF